MEAGDYIYLKDRDDTYQVCRILRLDPETDTAHVTSFAATERKPSQESLNDLRATILHAPVMASSFTNWTTFAKRPVTDQDLRGFQEYLKHTDFSRYAQETDQDIDQIVAEANRLYLEGLDLTSKNDNYREGIEKYHQAFELFPSFFEAKDNEAFCYMSLGEFAAAVGCFEDSIACNGHTLLTDFSIGECFFKLKAFEQAHPWFVRASQHGDIEPKTLKVLNDYIHAIEVAIGQGRTAQDAPIPGQQLKRPPGTSNILMALGCGAVMGFVAGALVLYIGFRENSQGEYYDPVTGAVDIPYALINFMLPFVLVTLGGFALAFFLLRQFRRP